MAIRNTHAATGSNYINDLLLSLRTVEGFVPTPYYDGHKKNSSNEYQNVTIGDGVNIDWSNATHLRLVLNELGLVSASTAVVDLSRSLAGLPPETPTEKVIRLDAMVTAFQKAFINNGTKGVSIELLLEQPCHDAHASS